ncbi:MAG: NrdH-redoxin [Epsilonproteobacteria bacterium]|nr:NrdH-redoxin [Campylobacterota bacterium]
MSEKRVVLFSTQTCSWCRKAEQYLKEKNVKFKKVDVSRDQNAANDMVRISGQSGVPVILIGSRPVVGFDRVKIDRLLAS